MDRACRLCRKRRVLLKKKNLFIELLRFLFCLMIFFHHSGFFASESMAYPFKNAGFFAVEFFFILTGAFAMKHVLEGAPEKGCMIYSMDYTLKKLKRVWPYAALGILLSYVWYFIQADPSLSFKDRLFGRWNILYELTFLPMTGVMSVDLGSFLNTPLWYLSVVLIALPIVVFLAIKAKDLFYAYLAWIIPLLLHGFLINRYGSIGNWGTYTVFAYSGLIRGLSDLMLGCFVFYLSTLISGKVKLPKAVVTAAEICMYIFVIYTFNTDVDGYTYEFAIIMLALAMAISLSGVSYTSEMKGQVWLHLGKLSLPVYCLHWPVYRFVSYIAPSIAYWVGVFVTLAVCIVLSELLMLVINRLSKKKVENRFS